MNVQCNTTEYVKRETCEDNTTETAELQTIQDTLTEKPPCVIDSVYVKMSPSKGKKKTKAKYTDEDLKKAVDALRNGKGLRATSKAFGIPRATLYDRASGRRPMVLQTRGPEPILGVEAENSIKDWLVSITRRGFTVQKEELLDTVQKIIVDNGIQNPFNNDRPGQTWYQSFLKRHPDLNIGAAKINKEAITEKSIKSWFSNLGAFLKNTNNDVILESPERIFCGDECIFSVCQKTGEVTPIMKPGCNQNLTAFLTCNAKGQMCPPLVVFACKRPSKAIVESAPGDWYLGRSDTGLMTRRVFYEYVGNGFNDWVERNRITKPVLLLVDGQSSHTSLFSSAMCDAQDIILYAMPPNSSHLLQPTEACVFSNLKSSWETIVSNYLFMSVNSNSCVTKTSFCQLFQEIIEDKEMEQNIQNAFKVCGIYPFDSNAVDCSKNVANTLEQYRKPTQNHSDAKEICNKDIMRTEKVLKFLKPVLKRKNIDVDLIIKEVRKLKRPDSDYSSTDSESEDDDL